MWWLFKRKGGLWLGCAEALRKLYVGFMAVVLVADNPLPCLVVLVT